MATTRLLAIDPGNAQSAYCLIDVETRKPICFDKLPNDMLRKVLYDHAIDAQEVVIEMVASYGMPVGKTVFETCVWIGRFMEAVIGWSDQTGLVYRHDVKMAICHNNSAKDSNIVQALIDRFDPEATNHGKGTKTHPGWFYGFRADIWQAYALAVTAVDNGLILNW